MTLEHELTTLPPEAITVLFYMAKNPDEASDVEMIKAGTGLSNRSMGKAMKRLAE